MSLNTALNLVPNAVYLPKATFGHFAVYASLILCLPSVNCIKCFLLREIMSFTAFSKMLQKLFTILVI